MDDIQRTLIRAGRKDLAQEYYQKTAKKYDVVSLRNNKKVIWNKKPLTKSEAEKMLNDLTKAKIPSVDMKSIEIVESKSAGKKAGIGYELYAKGLDRISSQCNTISDNAKQLAKLVRSNADDRKKKKALKDLQKWVNTLNSEMKGIVSDISNLEGYK